MDEETDTLIERLLNTQTPVNDLVELIDQISDDEDLVFDVITDPSASENVLELFVRAGMGEGLVDNPGASSALLKELHAVSGGDTAVLFGLASHQNADDELLSWLVEDVIAEGVFGADVVDKVLVHPNAGIKTLSSAAS